ncbi:putative small nucleolar ribonucleoprotein complex subunit [Venturia nashicola]|uniref:Putative small nucleolar ribonucleoprotein complex subunit n=1 Tax=Venturia nashicola TaxID=86259 RepID=A0A4Z1NRK8_9PEZI|nr:putative small nucleolar ribonucleoprotein complex subunit [Venturia nashicola]
MATEVAPIAPIRLPPSEAALTPDQKYWATFSSQILLPSPNSSPITNISSNSAASYASASAAPTSSYIAITTGPRLQLLSPQTLKPLKSITRSNTAFHSAHVRRDGRICLSGSESGIIQAYDTSSRAILKTWSEHKQPVWVTKWHPRELTTSMSCSDDGTVRLWDLPAESSTWQGIGHSDYVRSGTFVGDGNLIATGGYDQSIRLWDPRIGGSSSGSESKSRATVMHFKMPAPVESVLALPGGTTLVGSAGEKIAVLDLVAGRPLHLLQNHQKTVTSLAVASKGSRVLTGALDGHVKVFETASWNVVAGFKYPSPILSLDVVQAGPQREDRHLCVGMQSGLLSIRTRLSGAAKAAKKEKDKEMAALIAGKIEEYDKKKEKKKRGRGWEKSLRGKDHSGEGADIIIQGNDRSKPKYPTRWENFLRKGQYDLALDLVLEDTRNPIAVLTLLQALIHRSALRTALSNRNAKTILPLLRWLTKRVGDPRYVRVTTDVAMMVLELYGEHLGQSAEVDREIYKLHGQVRSGCEVAQMCWGTLGMVGLLEADSTKTAIS